MHGGFVGGFNESVLLFDNWEWPQKTDEQRRRSPVYISDDDTLAACFPIYPNLFQCLHDIVRVGFDDVFQNLPFKSMTLCWRKCSHCKSEIQTSASLHSPCILFKGCGFWNIYLFFLILSQLLTDCQGANQQISKHWQRWAWAGHTDLHRSRRACCYLSHKHIIIFWVLWSARLANWMCWWTFMRPLPRRTVAGLDPWSQLHSRLQFICVWRIPKLISSRNPDARKGEDITQV